MGNGNDKSAAAPPASGNNHHHFHFRHHSSKRLSLKPVNTDIINLVNSIDPSGQEIPISKIHDYFSKSYIIREIMMAHSNNLNGKTEAQADELKIASQQVLVILSDMYQETSNSGIVDLYTNILFAGDTELESETIWEILYDCFRFSLIYIGYETIELTESAKSTLNAILNSIQFTDSNNKKTISKSGFKEWTLNEFPQLFYGYHNWFISKITNKTSFEQKQGKNEDLSNFMNSVMIWYFVNNLPNCFLKNLASENGTVFEKLKNCIMEKDWRQLYNSDNHGLSLNRFQSNLFNYKAPTILFIYCSSGNLYCVCNNEEYRESPQPYGDDQTRIFRIWGVFKTFDITSNKSIYLNTRSRGLQLGLIFGYSQLKPVLKVSEDFSHVDHESMKNDQIVSVEVWGCGCTKAINKQSEMKNWEAKQIEKMRTVNRNSEAWTENADKTLLDLAGIKIEHSERGDI